MWWHTLWWHINLPIGMPLLNVKYRFTYTNCSFSNLPCTVQHSERQNTNTLAHCKYTIHSMHKHPSQNNLSQWIAVVVIVLGFTCFTSQPPSLVVVDLLPLNIIQWMKLKRKTCTIQTVPYTICSFSSTASNSIHVKYSTSCYRRRRLYAIVQILIFSYRYCHCWCRLSSSSIPFTTASRATTD